MDLFSVHQRTNEAQNSPALSESTVVIGAGPAA